MPTQAETTKIIQERDLKVSIALNTLKYVQPLTHFSINNETIEKIEAYYMHQNRQFIINYWLNYSPSEEDYNKWDNYSRTVIGDFKSNQNKIVYLTFDDGPMYTTLPVLDILKEYDVKATFFVNGLRSTNEEQNLFKLDMYKRIVDEGHVLGNHSFSHNYKQIYSSPQEYLKDFFELEELIYELTGNYTEVMRFPGGSNTTIGNEYTSSFVVDVMHDMGYGVFDWNVVDGDTSIPTLDQMRDNVLNGVRHVSEDKPIIVLYHDTHYGHKTTLPQVIEQLQSEGYVFEVLTKDSPQIIFRGPVQ